MMTQRERRVMLQRSLLWIDSRAGLTAGVIVLALSGWLSSVYALPHRFVVMMGVANLGYGTWSGMLARRARRPLGLLVLLIVGNAAWAIVCGLAVVHFANTASVFGLAHLVGEGVFVGALAVLEWRDREALRSGT